MCRQPFAHRCREPGCEAGERVENLGGGAGRPRAFALHLPQYCDHDFRVLCKTFVQEIVGRDSADTVRYERGGGKVAQVESDDHVRPRTNGSGKNMAVFRVVRHRANERFVSGNGCIEKVRSHLCKRTCRSCLCRKPLPAQRTLQLVENLF